MLKSIKIVLVLNVMFFGTFSLLIGGQTRMTNLPEWYNLLPEVHKPQEVDKIRAIENLRIKIRAPHDECAMSIMSTPWAIERAQYESLNQAKKLRPDLGEKEQWELVLMARFNIWEATIEQGLETHEYSTLTRSEELKKIKTLKTKISAFKNNFVSFADVIRFTICLEEELGNFRFPAGQAAVFEELNSILGRTRPCKEDMTWYFSVFKKL